MRLTTEQDVLRQRRRPHRSGLLPKGELGRRVKEQLAREQREREQAASGQQETVNNVEIQPTESSFFEFEPDVYYDAIVQSIDEVPNNFPDARSATQLRWEFRVDSCQNDDGTVATKRGWSTPIWNPRAKTYKWALAILGAVDKDAPFRTSALIEQPCRIVLVSGINDQGVMGTSLNVVAPLKKAAAPATAKKPGLVSQLKKDGPPAGAAISDPTDIGVCDEPGTAFSGKGKPLCDLHAEQVPVELAM